MEVMIMEEKGFTPEMLEILMDSALKDADLKSEEIPRIDLYIDQILTLVSDRTSEASERYRDNLLTKTMINNYSKEGLIMPVKGKKYTKEHIIQMLLIYSLKNSLSIGEIKRLIKGAYLEGFDGEMLTRCYDRFVDGKEEARCRAKDITRGIVGGEDVCLEDSGDFFVSLLSILACSAYLRSVAVEMLEARYPIPEEDKEKDKEKSKEKTKEKKSKEEDK